MELYARIREILFEGNVLLSFSDTVTGLFCHPYSDKAVSTVRMLKRRDPSKGFIMLISDISGLCSVGGFEKAFISRFWPGPLTIILPCSEPALASLSPDGRTMAVRYPSDSFWTGFLKYHAFAVLSTSANEYSCLYSEFIRDSRLSKTDYQISFSCFIKGYFYELIKLSGSSIGIDFILSRKPFLEDRPCLPSTLISLFNNRLNVLREGKISSSELYAFYRKLSSV